MDPELDTLTAATLNSNMLRGRASGDVEATASQLCPNAVIDWSNGPHDRWVLKVGDLTISSDIELKFGDYDALQDGAQAELEMHLQEAFPIIGR